MERLENQASSLTREKGVLASELASGIQGVCKECEALGFENGKQLGGCSIISGEPEASNPCRVASRTKEVDIALSSLAETDFVGLFRLGELD
ncbi:unnamed protein product [Lactuca saligna]|uniref:Uncharacterized protein n=1 Tax=Lactuca saligna TaxID=75948 RepID=A0AA36A2E8_LACSI|nr:unnamed protein product [Lactuca saligna]